MQHLDSLFCLASPKEWPDAHTFDISLSSQCMYAYSRIMLVYKWSTEVELWKTCYLQAICGPRSALDHPASYWSLVPQQSLSVVEWHESGKLTYCRALLLLLPETMESHRYQQSLSPSRTRIRSYCTKLNPPPCFLKPQRNTQARDAAAHLICNRRMLWDHACTGQPVSHSWMSA